jgi:hypothetical protein
MSDGKTPKRSIEVPQAGDEPAEDTATNEAPKPGASLDLSIFKKKLLKDWGMQLPIGMPGMGDRSFSFRRYMLDEEVKIAEFKQSKQVTLGRYVAQILAHMLTSLGGQDYSKMEASAKVAALLKMYAADVLYMYYWLRIEGMGEFMDWDMQCSRCESSFVFESDFNTMEVQVVEEGMDLVWDYETKRGFQLGDKLFKVLTMHSPYWAIYDSAEFKGEINNALATAAVIRSSIVAADGEPVGIVDATLRKGMHKYDYEHLGKFMDKRMGGPQMTLELDCPDCKRKINEIVPWMHPDFLSITSFKGIRSMV